MITNDISKPAARRAGSNGFTLLELLLGIAIIGVVATLGILYVPRGQLQAREAARIVAADLNLARSEAVRLNTNVAFDFSNASCEDYCIYTDFGRSGAPDANLDGDSNGTADISSPILVDRRLTSEFPRMSIQSFDFASSPRIWFDVRGLPRGSTGAYLGATGEIVLRASGGDSGYLVTLEPQGRVQVGRE